MTKVEITNKINEVNKQLEVAKSDLSKASCQYKKLKNELTKLYKASFELVEPLPTKK